MPFINTMRPAESLPVWPASATRPSLNSPRCSPRLPSVRWRRQQKQQQQRGRWRWCVVLIFEEGGREGRRAV